MNLISRLLICVIALSAARAGAAPAKSPTQANARGGCDGVINGRYGFHTNEDATPWWQVDLEKEQAIDRVVIYNRVAVPHRAAHIHVLVSADAKAWTTIYRHDGTTFFGHNDNQPLVVNAERAKGRYVRVQSPERTWLHLDEVEVYGPGDAKKNLALNKPADQSSTYGGGGARPAVVAPPRPEKLLAAGRLLAADLKAAGVDTATFEAEAARLEAKIKGATAPAAAAEVVREIEAAVRPLALANPLLDFDQILLVRRGAAHLGLPQNWQSNSSLRPTGYDNDLAVIDGVRGGALRQGPARAEAIKTLYRPEKDRFVGDVDLHFDGSRLLFSMPDEKNRWQVWEMALGQASPRQVPLIPDADVHNYDACYLPDGDILFTSTAPFVGVPCVRGSSHVTNLYRLRAADGQVRRLTFDQEHNWSPAVMNDGRVLYTRWEYSDLPHSNSARLFSMNPDGTQQRAYYASSSYWPNRIFYARPIPGHRSKVAGIVSGHHGVPRMGEMVVFDPSVSDRESEGAVQRIGDRDRAVEPTVADQLVNASWPKFLHPYPLSEKYFLVSAQRSPSEPWGVYLVDVFDNMVLLARQDGYALFEPVPVRATPRPPVVPSRTLPGQQDATVYLADVYAGAMQGVPRGSVRKLRLITYHYSYHGVGGLLGVVGADGPWDIKRVLGTVPVAENGSAYFKVPANTPIAVQPLDEAGRAMQVMRSWFVGMPGEVVSCVGCHERSYQASPAIPPAIASRAPSPIEPWRGKARGFSFQREVQPVIDKYCVGCHSPAATERFDASTMPDLRGEPLPGWKSAHPGNGGGDQGKFSIAYEALARYVRRPGIESDMHTLKPMEYHASTTELMQLLRKGHHGVALDDEAWDRLCTWIDLNAPYHGTWTEVVGSQRTRTQAERRTELMKRYADVSLDEEFAPEPPARPAPVIPPAPPAAAPLPTLDGWPFGPEQAKKRQAALGKVEETIDLGDGVKLEMVRVPAGEFVMGSTGGPADEAPASVVRIARAFWMGRLEVTNEQFAKFDPLHDSHVESKHGYQFGIHGYPLNEPRQPVVRVSWKQAMAFCRWMSERTGRKFTLPTEAQWEWACRAGAATPFSFGAADANFSRFANLGDVTLRELASDPYTAAKPMTNPGRADDWVPRDARFSDGALVTAAVGKYAPNAWGLHDMHGNAWEWTLSAARPYPWRDDDGRNDADSAGPRIVRGGSWYDRPRRATAGYRLAYEPWQGVFNVGFRVVCPAD